MSCTHVYLSQNKKNVLLNKKKTDQRVGKLLPYCPQIFEISLISHQTSKLISCKLRTHYQKRQDSYLPHLCWHAHQGSTPLQEPRMPERRSPSPDPSLLPLLPSQVPELPQPPYCVRPFLP